MWFWKLLKTEPGIHNYHIKYQDVVKGSWGSTQNIKFKNSHKPNKPEGATSSLFLNWHHNTNGPTNQKSDPHTAYLIKCLTRKAERWSLTVSSSCGTKTACVFQNSRRSRADCSHSLISACSLWYLQKKKHNKTKLLFVLCNAKSVFCLATCTVGVSDLVQCFRMASRRCSSLLTLAVLFSQCSPKSASWFSSAGQQTDWRRCLPSSSTWCSLCWCSVSLPFRPFKGDGEQKRRESQRQLRM